ncbi:hypothetical protein EUA93_18835 [Nocardioides oleivorans]|uniref:Uncharacterized protein n=1 Tax=Nocardioides oleivorans TaxID=273676 RepID=A0A4V1RK44_9ACTN|nr:hypothetical protein [Nocardioides oleivorans]RYB90992.1 hypothetical protein EUA93_18835 [Nocardioides oleivorans]
MSEQNGTTSAPERATYPGLFDLVIERRQAAWDAGLYYDPWTDLTRRTGVNLEFRNGGPYEDWKDPWGLTNFNDLDVTLRFGLTEWQLRSTLAHELVHLDRGPRADHTSEAVDENRTNRLAAQRMIDPVVFDKIMELGNGKPNRWVINHALGVDLGLFRHYRGWRKTCKESTAMKAFEASRTKTPWPAPWVYKLVQKHPGNWPYMENAIAAAESAARA